MDKIIAVSFKAIGSIFAPGMLFVFLGSVALTMLVLSGLVALATGIGTVLSSSVADEQIASMLPWFSGLGAALLAYLLFPGIMPIIVNFFDSTIARIIEQKDYPDARPIDPPFWPEFWHDVRFTCMAILINILALPFYFIPILGQILFFLINGHLLGKEFFVMSARRYMPVADAVALHKAHGRMILCGGIILVVCAMIPFVNLLAPFWGIAVMTHLYHDIKGTAKVQVLPPQ